MKKYAALIILLSSIFTSLLSAETVQYNIPFSFYRGADVYKSPFYDHHKDPTILIEKSYKRTTSFQNFAIQFGFKPIHDIGDGNFGYPHYLTSQHSSEYYQLLRKGYLYSNRQDY